MAYKFMIIDDSSIVRGMIKKIIKMTSVEVAEIFEAANGKEGLEQLSNKWVDLIFLDINMPIMNGMEFMEKLRLDPNLKDLPVVVVSTEGAQDRIDRMKELKVKDYLRKPFTPEQITNVISILLGGTNA